MEDEKSCIVSCNVCCMFTTFPEDKPNFTCHKCKLVALLEEKVKDLEERVATLKVIRESENFLDRAEETLQNDLIEENLAEPSEAEGWKHVTHRTRKVRRHSEPLQLKNRFHPLSQENNEDMPQVNTTVTTKITPPCTQKPLEQRERRGTVKKKRRRVVVVGDSLLRGTEAAVCRPDQNSREVCCLPGARIKDVTDSISRLFSPTDYYPFLLIHVGTNDTARNDLATICSDFEDLGRKVKELGAQVVFSSILPVDGHGKRRWDRILEVNNWLRRWCYQQGFGFLNQGENYLYDGLLARDGLHLTKTGKNVFGKRLASLIRRALN